jgi:hypothetical protein
MGLPIVPDPLQLFSQPVEPGHEETAGVAGVAGDQMAPQAEKVVQEVTSQAPADVQQDAGRRPADGEVQDRVAVVHEAQKLSHQSPASPASPAAIYGVHGAEVHAAREAVVQAGAGSTAGEDGQRPRCRVQRCEEVPFASGWCAVHEDRAEILRIGARLGYPVLSYVSEHATQQGEAAWMQFLRYPQCHRLAELLLLYLREQYPEHFPQERVPLQEKHADGTRGPGQQEQAWKR